MFTTDAAHPCSYQWSIHLRAVRHKNDGLSHFSIPDFRYAEALSGQKVIYRLINYIRLAEIDSSP